MPGGISSTGLTAVPIPGGGLAGQVLVKLSNDTGDYDWGVGGGGGSDVTGLSLIGTVFNLTQSGGTSPLTVDLATGGVVFDTRDLIAGAGLTGGGDLSADRTFNVIANADGSITVNANDIQVGVLATDAQHGTRGGGTLHAIFTGAVAGFAPTSPGGTSAFLRADGTWATPPAFGEYNGTFDASVGTFPGGVGTFQGDWYNTTVAGTVGGEAFNVGDLLVALIDNPSTTVFAGSWTRIPNVSTADVQGPPSATDTAIALYDGTTGKLIKNGVVLIDVAGNLTNVGTINGLTLPAAFGDVVGPAASVDDRLVTFNGVTGKLIQDGTTLTASSDTIDSSGNLQLNPSGGNTLLGGQTASGVVELYANFNKKVETTTQGIALYGNSVNNPIGGGLSQTTEIEFFNRNAISCGFVGLDSTPNFVVHNRQNQGEIQLSVTSAGVNKRDVFLGDPAGLTTVQATTEVSLVRGNGPPPGTEVARTIVETSGGLQVNNQLTGAGLERVLTVSDIPAVVTPRGAGAGLVLNVNDLDVAANADGSITVNVNDIQVGVLATDAQHGTRGGGTLHAAFTAGVSGFAPASGGGTANFLRADGTWVAPLSVFGSNFESSFSAIEQSSTSTTYVTPFTYTTAVLPAGDYIFMWSFDGGETSDKETSHRVLIDGTPVSTAEWRIKKGVAADGKAYIMFAGHRVQTLGAGTHTISFQYRTAADTAYIRNKQVSIYRVN